VFERDENYSEGEKIVEDEPKTYQQSTSGGINKGIQRVNKE
jgi:hypothetical protein